MPQHSDVFWEFTFAFLNSTPATLDENVLNLPYMHVVGNIHFNKLNKVSHWYISDSASDTNKLFSPLNVFQLLQWWNIWVCFLPAENDVVRVEHSAEGQKEDRSQTCP